MSNLALRHPEDGILLFYLDGELPGRKERQRSVERIGDFQRHPTNVLDLDIDALAVLKRAKPLVVRAARDQVA